MSPLFYLYNVNSANAQLNVYDCSFQVAMLAMKVAVVVCERKLVYLWSTHNNSCTFVHNVRNVEWHERRGYRQDRYSDSDSDSDTYIFHSCLLEIYKIKIHKNKQNSFSQKFFKIKTLSQSYYV